MPRTLLIGHAGVSWREWLKANRKGRDLLLLDPADPNFGAPGRLTLWRGEKLLATRFFGSLDALRSPHIVAAVLAEFLSIAGEDVLIQLAPYRPTPLGHQLLLLLAAQAKADTILLANGTNAPCNAFPIGPEDVALEPAFPAMVQTAQRKAQWLKMLESCRPHEVDLRQVCIEGARLGSGQKLDPMSMMRGGIEEAHHAELIGSSLFVVSDDEPEDQEVARALDDLNASRAFFVTPSAYEGLLCSFARNNGEDFGYGMIQRIDFEAGIAHILNTAETPAPVRILRIGSLRINERGSELGETRPWQV